MAGAALLAQAVLNQAEFVDNRMQGLSVAMLGTAVAGTVTIRDNSITDCIGGIWFASQSQDNVVDAGIFQAALGICSARTPRRHRDVYGNVVSAAQDVLLHPQFAGVAAAIPGHQ
jgi:hypothetical protein